MKLSFLSYLFAAVALPLHAQAAFTSASSTPPPPPPPPPPPGATQFDPVFPSTWLSASGAYGFRAWFSLPSTNRWYSTGNHENLWLLPVVVDGLAVHLDGGSFQSVTAPVGYGSMQLRVDGVLVDADFNAGEVFAFSPLTSDFQIFISSPATLPAGAASESFQMKVQFLGGASIMKWTSIEAAPVPETSTFALTLLGLVGVGALLGSRRRKAA
jgi:hypothetical protein